jgi:heme-degrading monooxygenase HmoA
MPKIATEDAHLTVLNLFTTDAPEKQERLIHEMRQIVDAATYPGWISSTVHSGINSPGTANFIQWRSGEDLQERYKGEEFKHRTLPVFGEITTSIRLLQNEIAYAQRHPKLNGVTAISPDRDDYTVIEVFNVTEENQHALVDALGSGQEWLLDVPGYRSHSVLRTIGARGPQGPLENTFVVRYSQWDSKEAHDAFITTADDQKSPERQKLEAQVAALILSRDWNSYRVVHTRAAGE